jgi:hypothetical protein
MIAASHHEPLQRRESRPNSTWAVSSSRPPLAVAPTEFAARCEAGKLFVVVRDDAGSAQVCTEMDRIADGEWQLALHLPLGHHRYRYYAVHDAVTFYVSPDDVECRPVCMNGLDALLDVAGPKSS